MKQTNFKKIIRIVLVALFIQSHSTAVLHKQRILNKKDLMECNVVFEDHKGGDNKLKTRGFKCNDSFYDNNGDIMEFQLANLLTDKIYEEAQKFKNLIKQNPEGSEQFKQVSYKCEEYLKGFNYEQLVLVYKSTEYKFQINELDFDLEDDVEYEDEEVNESISKGSIQQSISSKQFSFCKPQDDKIEDIDYELKDIKNNTSQIADDLELDTSVQIHSQEIDTQDFINKIFKIMKENPINNKEASFFVYIQ